MKRIAKYSKSFQQILIALLLLSSFGISCKTEDTINNKQFDLLVQNGKIVDGTGKTVYFGDVGIIDGAISAIGDLDGKSATTTIDAEGLIVSPGFIDPHTHCDDDLGKPESKANLNYLSQGVTTVVTGNCGFSVSLDVAETKKQWEDQGIGTNVVYLVGHSTIRNTVIGKEPRQPTQPELQQMQSLLRQAMREGAWGLSTGLEYVPGRYAATEEIIELTRVVSEFGGVYTSHMRNEAAQIVDAIKETIRIGKETGVPVNIAHLKVTGKNNWGLMQEAVKTIQNAGDKGIEITADQYPYIQSAPIGLIWSFLQIPVDLEPFSAFKKKLKERKLSEVEQKELQNQYVANLVKALSDPVKREKIRKLTVEGLPNDPSAVAMWGWHDFRILVATKNRHLVGKNFIELGREQNRDIFDIIVDLIIDEPDMLYAGGSQSKKDHALALQQAWLMVSSDGGAHPPITASAKPVRGHPRDFGSQTKILRKFVREDKLLSLEAAIRKMTSLPAAFLKMKNRGILREGYKADLVLFSPETVRDLATYANSRKYCSGVEYVIIDGKICIEKGQYTGALNGKVLLLTENN